MMKTILVFTIAIVGGPMKHALTVAALMAAVILPYSFIVSYAQAGPQYISQKDERVPDHVVYELYFRKLALYEDLAMKKENSRSNGIRLRAFIKNELGIDENEYALMIHISTKALEKAAKLDEQAAAIIQREHSRYPDGKIPSWSEPPAIPNELQALQESRNAIFARGRDDLAKQLAPNVFLEVDSRIKAVVKLNSNIK